MKKLLKTCFTIMLIISLVFVITGCGNSEQESNQENAKSKTYNALNSAFAGDNYTISVQGNMDLGDGVENTIMTLAKKGENTYMDVDTDSNHLTVMYKDDTTYVISHDDEMYMTEDGKSEEIFTGDDMFVFSKEDLANIESLVYTTGKEEIDGTEYDYEEYKYEEDGTTERYYFSGDNLEYIKTINESGEEELIKIVKLTSEVDESLFNIPENYQEIAR